jgi:hypothetical protein
MFFESMNILNVDDIERELAKYAAQAIHPAAKTWVKSVARNHILGKLSDKDIAANFREYSLNKRDAFMPAPEDLPIWAWTALKTGQPIHWFDWAQPQRRTLWQALEMIVLWFNTFQAGDTRFKRCDRICFDVAARAGALWFKDVNENIWLYIKDKPPVVKKYDNGYHWVRLVTAVHFEREGKLMRHCVGNGGYYDKYQSNACEYYSLRDKHNEPHCTIELAVDRAAVIQCKGTCNQKPARTYQRFIRRFINEMNWTIDGDSSHIDYID